MTFELPQKKANSEVRKGIQIRESTHDIIKSYAEKYETSMTKVIDAIMKAHTKNYPL
jgi:hypothetical protein